jgi:hypothetical protein
VKTVPNPDDPYEDELDEPRGPEIEYDFQPLPSGEIAELRTDNGRWIIIIDQDHPVVRDYLEERVLGNAGPHKGIDGTRTAMLLAHVIAAATVSNEDVAKAMPFLHGYEPARRYGIAASHLIRTLIARRR